MTEEEHAIPSAPPESESEKMLREKLGGRTILVVLLSVLAVIELLIIVRLAVK